MKIAIIGLGYVGLPLALQFARSGVTVLGLDIDPEKIGLLHRGKSYIKHIAGADIAAAVASKSFSASTDFSRVREVEAIIICVPTPLTKNREPDISYILKTGEAIAPFLRRDQSSGLSPQPSGLRPLVVLESTTYPGTTDEDLRKVLEGSAGVPPALFDVSSKSNLKSKSKNSRAPLVAGKDFHLAFSPEREDPGNPNSKVADIPKIVGGYTPECLRRAVALYSRAVRTVVPVSSCRAAEATKLLENIFRSVNIALVNELKVVYAAMGIDIWEVVAAAKTKPFGFMPFYPGPGLGGHCIPIDPFYLTWKAREFGKATRFIELAGEVNTAMPEYVAGRVAEALNAQKKSVRGSKILLLGLAYKADVDDMRESPTFALMDLLKARGAAVAYYDPHLPVIKPTREHGHWTGTKSVKWNRKIISGFDLVLISTAHNSVNYGELAGWSRCIVDTRNIMAKIKTKVGRVWKA